MSGNEENELRVWDTATGTLLNSLESHTSRVLSAAFSSTGEALVSASDDATLRIWNIPSDRCSALLKGYNLWVEV